MDNKTYKKADEVIRIIFACIMAYIFFITIFVKVLIGA
tara:strand:- start:9846 stop:9959 length:114 start_codon:yes stop_codon:yes gene_type:complete